MKNKTRYVAQWIANEDDFGIEPYTQKYTEKICDNLSVALETANANDLNNEGYVSFQEFNPNIYGWQDVQRYNCAGEIIYDFNA